MKNLIKKLVETVGPSGYEGQIREVIKAEAKKYSKDITVDALGNLIVRVGKKTGNGRRIMVSGHMDEIGIIATHIDKKGFIRFALVGGVGARFMPGSRVKFLDGTLGTIQSEPPESVEKVSPLTKLFVDVGAVDDVSCPVKVGDMAGFDRPMFDCGQRLISKAMDNRISCAVMLGALEKIKNPANELVFVFSTQEEVGTRGATTAAYHIDPDIGLAVDVTGVGDTPSARPMEVSLGKGPAIKLKDGGMISDTRIVEWMRSTAKAAKLPYQLEILEGGTTDARAMQMARAGVPAGCLSIPTRYIHSPSEMVDIDDVENAVELLSLLCTKPVSVEV